VKIARKSPFIEANVKHVADSDEWLSFHARLRGGSRMNAQPTPRAAWLEPAIRALLGIALIAAVIWAVTEGGAGIG
jgi:hypothetical protein